MSLRPAGGAGRSALVVAAVVVAGVLLSRIWLLAQPPTFSDIPAYQHDAALWGAAGEEGVSFYGLHRAYVIATSEALGHEPPEGTTLIEYPPLALGFVAAVNLGLPSSTDPQDPALLQAYTDRYRLLAFAVDLGVLLVLTALALRGGVRAVTPARAGPRLARGWALDGAWRLAVFGTGGVAIYYILYDRLDLFEGALLLASLLTLIRGWWRVALVLLGVAIAFKVYPAVLAPLWLVASLPAGWLATAGRDPGRLALALLRRTALLGCTVVAIFVPFLVLQGPDALQFIAFNAQRGVQLESVGAAVLLVLQAFGSPLDIVARYGAYEVVGPLAPAVAAASIPLTGLAVLFVGLLFLRAVRRDLAGPGVDTAAGRDGPDEAIVAARAPGLVTLATVATLMLVLVTAKVLSPQYLLWLLPLVPLLDGGRAMRLWQAGFVGLLALSTVVFPGLYSSGALSFAIVVRDAVLVVLAFAICAALASGRFGDRHGALAEARPQVVAEA